MQSTGGRDVDCVVVQDLANDFVMGTLDSGAHEAVAAHCLTCARCQSLVDELSSTVSMLAFATLPVAPPPTAKAALFARIAQSAVPEKSPSPWGDTSLNAFRTPSLPAAPVIPALAATTSDETEKPASKPWYRFVSYAAPLATIPLILALGFVGYWGASTRMDLNDRNQTVGELNASVQFLNARVDSLSTGMEDFEQYLNPETSKHYAMLDPSPSSSDESQAFGLLLVNSVSGDTVIMTWRLDPSVEVYEMVVEFVDNRSASVADLFVDAEGDAMRRVDLGGPLSEIQSIHIRPKIDGFSNDSDLNANQPDALYAAIWPGINGMQDTIPLQTYP